ncbi:hydroxymethylglutaryl-CoA lyase [Bacillus sp. FJAT-50079]|uniref:hydroxymethylglutaryl-CoA lyase n=1 Tax=Bacillus sp. FJAT-50079 TaxID=2833577 RepID=UPI001BCA5BC8|nr:hydroxymethylglutaryl-CoA lyase [Bacillus sp. FJAT-50079]MBS4206626.1 hydroxymethylglutaryl-CoA lyase [Bacillus sp. FJAT-50079]
MGFPIEVNIVEVGPRDGLQNIEKNLETSKKIDLIKGLVEAGVTEIEATSFVHPKWIPNLADAEEVIKKVRDLPATMFALVPNEVGYNRAKEVGVDGVTLVMSATDGHNLKNLNRDTEASIQETIRLLNITERDQMKARVSISVAFGCPFQEKVELDEIVNIVERLAENGAKRIGFCDTIGVANPRQVSEWMKVITKLYPHILFELHFHNTYGRGLANIVAGLEGGITHFDASIGGLGGCPYAPNASGNIATEDVLNMMAEMNIKTNINEEKILEVTQKLFQSLHCEVDSQVYKVKQKTINI